MTDQPGIHLTDLHLALQPASGNAPFEPVVQRLHLLLTDDVLQKLVEWALVKGRDRAPVDVELRSTRFIGEGAEIIVQVSKGRFFKTDVRALIGISANDAEQLRVEIKEVKALGKLPIDAFVEPVVDKALVKASALAGIERAPGSSRALLVQPGVVLAGLGIRLKFGANGVWQARTTEGALDARFRVTD